MTWEPLERRPIRGWTIEATCPACGNTLEHQADGRPTGGETRAIARCSTCRRRWLVEVTVTEAASRGVHGPGSRPSHPIGCRCATCLARSAA